MHTLFQITAQGFVENRANEQLSLKGSRYRRGHDHMAVVGVLLAHHWVLRVNVFDPDHLEETQMHLSGDLETKNEDV